MKVRIEGDAKLGEGKLLTIWIAGAVVGGFAMTLWLAFG